MQAIQVGMLRSTGELSTLKDIAVETDKFGLGAVKFTMEQEAVEVNLESSRDSGLVMIKNKLPLDELNNFQVSVFTLSGHLGSRQILTTSGRVLRVDSWTD